MNENRISKIAVKVTIAYDAQRVHKEFPKLLQELKTGDWKYYHLFTNAKKPKSQPNKSGEIKTGFIKYFEESIDRVVKEMPDLEIDKDMMWFSIIGTAGRSDVYSFTKETYDVAVEGGKVPKKKNVDIREEIKDKLSKMGLHNLGKYSGKSGEQFGLADSARRVAVGAVDLLANYLYVEHEGDGKYDGQNSRWSLQKNWLISKVTDAVLQDVVKWIVDGPTMKEVRQSARMRFQAKVAANTQEYGKFRAIAAGYEDSNELKKIK